MSKVLKNYLLTSYLLLCTFFVYLFFVYFLRSKCLWVRISLLSLKCQLWDLFGVTSSLTLRETIGCGFILKIVRDITRIYSESYSTDKYSKHKSIIRSARLNGWVLVCQLSGCGFTCRWSHLIFSYDPDSTKEFLDIQANHMVLVHSGSRRWHYNNIHSNVTYE